MDFVTFLNWAGSPGINLIIGFLESFAVEWIPNWGTMDAKRKRVVMLGVSLAVPLTAALLGAATGHYSWNFEATFWPALVSGMSAFTGSTTAHLRKLITKESQ